MYSVLLAELITSASGLMVAPRAAFAGSQNAHTFYLVDHPPHKIQNWQTPIAPILSPYPHIFQAAMSSISLCDKSDRTVMSTSSTDSVNVKNSMKFEYRRPSDSRSSLMPPLVILKISDSQQLIGRQEVIDQLTDVEALLGMEEEARRSSTDCLCCSFQEDDSWQEFCDDLPLE
jgi:hypothetical protein